MTGVTGDLAFSGLDDFVDGGNGLVVTGSCVFDMANGTGFRLITTGPNNVVTTTNGTGIVLDTIDLDPSSMNFSQVNTAGTITRIRLNNLSDTYTVNSGTIPSFEVVGGTCGPHRTY